MVNDRESVDKTISLDKSTLDLLNCIVCLETPFEEIYECREGHNICHTCFHALPGKVCPLCKIPYGQEKIRNRTLEKLVERLVKAPCRYRDNGCTEKLRKNKLLEHEKICKKSGTWVQVCKFLGFGNCDHEMNTIDVASSMEHFEQVHHANTEHTRMLIRRKLSNVMRAFKKAKIGSIRCFNLIFKSPQCLTLEDGHSESYILVHFEITEDTFSCISLYLGNSTTEPQQNKYNLSLKFGSNKTGSWNVRNFPVEPVLGLGSYPPKLMFQKCWLFDKKFVDEKGNLCFWAEILRNANSEFSVKNS